MAGTLRLNNTGTGNGQSTITTAATGDATYTLPSVGGTFLTTSGNVTFQFASGTVSAPSVTFVDDLDTGLYSPGANQVAIATSGTAAITVDASQRVGVGTTPSQALHVVGTADTTPVAFKGSGTGTGYLYADNTSFGVSTNSGNLGGTSAFVGVDSGNHCLFITSGTEVARIDSSGRLLVGTASSVDSSAKTQIVGDDSIRHLAFKYTGTSGGAEQQIKWVDKNNQVNAVICNNLQNDAIGTAAAHLIFKTSISGTVAERMRIEGNGIFRTFSDSDGVFTVRNAGSAGGDSAFIVYKAATSTLDGTACAVIRQDGDLENTNNSYGALSDIKLKENVVDAASQWSDIKTLQVRKYNFKEITGHSTHTQIGLIAQEVELVSPGLVSESPDRDEDGNDLGTVTKSVNYSVLYMKAVKALQEAMERIETLEASNNDLLVRVSALESA